MSRRELEEIKTVKYAQKQCQKYIKMNQLTIQEELCIMKTQRRKRLRKRLLKQKRTNIRENACRRSRHGTCRSN